MDTENMVVAKPRKAGGARSRGEQRTEEIVRAASELFLHKGYENTSLDEIIEQTGGSKAHVYRKFGGKEQLFLACVEFLCDEVQIPLGTLDVSGHSAEEGLRILSRALVELLLGDRHIAFQRLIFAEATRFPDAGEIWFRRGPQTTSGIFRGAIRKWMQTGELRAGDARVAADLLCDMLSGHLLDRRWLGIGEKPTAAERKRTIDAAIRIFLDGYRG
jgi:AcrR family transcriptional regulator